jgi:hypothetical protein
MEPGASHSEIANADGHATARTWQFSLRSLLIATTIVSVCLAIGVHFAGLIFAVAAVGLTQAAMLLSADWLIRPQNRRALAFVTAGSWIVLGSSLLVIGGGQVYGAFKSDDARAAWMLGGCLIAGGLSCYLLAAKRWRSLTQADRADPLQ